MGKPRKPAAVKHRPAYYPLFLDLRGQKAVVIGGGRVAERKVRALLASGARVRVISPKATAYLKQAAESGNILWQARKFRAGDLGKTLLIFAATDDLRLNRRIGKLAKDQGKLVNVAKPPEGSNFLVPAAIRRGDLVVAISTRGQSPALAKGLRQAFQKILPGHLADAVKSLGKVRRNILSRIPEEKTRRKALKRGLRLPVLSLIRPGRTPIRPATGPRTSRSRSGSAKRSGLQKNR